MTYIIIPKDYISPLKMKTLPIHHPSSTVHHPPLLAPRACRARHAPRRYAFLNSRVPKPRAQHLKMRPKVRLGVRGARRFWRQSV